MSNYITDTYSLKYYGETENYRGQQSRVEIWWKGTVDATFPRRIGDITALSLSINGNEDIDAPVVKTILNLSMADTWDEPQVAAAGAVKHGVWDEFYTPDSTAYLVRLYTRQHGENAWEPRWSGYITPDNWQETIGYRGAVSIVARDNLGHLQDFEFDLPGDADGMVSAHDVITGALAKIAFPMDVILGDAADGGRVTLLEADAAAGSRGVWDALVLASQFKGRTWEDAFEDILDSLGLTVRYVDHNTVVVTFIRNLPLCGGSITPPVQDVEFYGPGTRMLVPAYREVVITAGYDYRQSVPFPGGVTGQYGANESFSWSYYDERQHRTVSGTAMRTDVVSGARGWGSSGKAFVNTATYRTSSPRDQVAVIDPETTSLIIANAIQADVRAAMAIYNFGAVNTPAGRVRLEYTFSLSLYGQYLIRSGSLESLEWAASYQTNDALLWWNGSQWKANEQTWTLSENGDMDFSSPMNIQDVPDGGTLRIYVRDVKATAGFCLAVNGVTLTCVDPARSLKSDTVTVVNDAGYNVRAERSPEFAPMSKAVAWNIPDNYANVLWRRRGGAIGPFPYEVIWSDGEERLPLPVQWAKQTLMFHHSTLQLIEGEIGVPENGMWRFDRPAYYKGHYFIPQGGTLDLNSGHLTGASLREYIEYSTLWAGGVTVAPQTAAFPSEGGTASFLLSCAADKDWLVTGLPDWLAADVTSGRGSGIVTLTASMNEGGARSRTIYIGGVAVSVTQAQEEFELTVAPDSITAPADGDDFYLEVSAPAWAHWRLVADDDWLLVNGFDEYEGTGYNDAVILLVQANETGQSRTGTVTLYDDEGNLAHTVTVTQPAVVQSFPLTVTANVSSPSVALKVNGTSVSYSPGIEVTAGATVAVTVSKSGYNPASETFTMPSRATDKYYTLTPDVPVSFSSPDYISAEAQRVQITVSDQGGKGWGIDFDNPKYQGYITGAGVTSGSATVSGTVVTGTGNAIVWMQVTANSSTNTRNIGAFPNTFYTKGSAKGSWQINSDIGFSQLGTSSPIIPVTGVSLDRQSATIEAGDTTTLTATVSPSNATNKTVAWTSSDTSVAVVSASGVVTGVKPGTTTIRATADDGSGKYATCSVTVTPTTIPVTGVSLDRQSATMGVGGTTTLVATIYPPNATNKGVTWTSSDTSVATVSQSGVVTAVGAGDCVITVTTVDGGYTATCSVTVSQTTIPVTGVTLDKQSDTMNVGDTDTLTATVAPSNATNKGVAWSSSDTSVATVSSSGIVTAVGAGSCVITVTTDDGGFTATCGVTVTPTTIPVTGVSLDRQSATMEVGDTTTLVATIYPPNATNKGVTWTSSDTSVATVSQSGVVTAVGAGSCDVFAVTADGGFTATCGVVVRDIPTPPEPGVITVDDLTVAASATSGSVTVGTERVVISSLSAATSAGWVTGCNVDTSGTVPRVRMYFGGNGTTSVRTATVTVTGTDSNGDAVSSSFTLTQQASSSSDVPCTEMGIEGPEGIAISSNEAEYTAIFYPSSTTQKDCVWSLSAQGGEDISDKVVLEIDGLKATIRIIGTSVRNLSLTLVARNSFNSAVSASKAIVASYVLPPEAIQVNPGYVTVAAEAVSDTTPVLILADGIDPDDLVVETSGIIQHAGISKTLHILTTFTANTGASVRSGSVVISYTDPTTLETVSVTVYYTQSKSSSGNDYFLSAIALNVQQASGLVTARFLVSFGNRTNRDYIFKGLGYTLSGVDGNGDPTFATRSGTLNEKTVAALSTEGEIYTVSWQGSVAGTTQYTLTVRNGTQLSSTLISDGNDFI